VDVKHLCVMVLGVETPGDYHAFMRSDIGNKDT
jgi:hypothetical protein